MTTLLLFILFLMGIICFLLLKINSSNKNFLGKEKEWLDAIADKNTEIREAWDEYNKGNKILKGETKTLSEQLKIVNNQVEEYKKTIKAIQKEIEQKTKEFNQATTNLESKTHKLNIATQEISSLQTKEKNLLKEVSDNLKNLKELTESKNSLENYLKEINAYENYEASVELAKLIEKKKSIKQEISDCKIQLAEFTEKLNLQEIGLTKTYYHLENSEAFKDKIKNIRHEQRLLIQESKSTTYDSISNTIKSNINEWKKTQKNLNKSIIRSFNSDCELNIGKLKNSTLSVVEVKIHKSFEDINKAFSIFGIAITNEYLKLKIKEANIVQDYEEFKLEEKERLAEERIALREAAKIAREIAEAREKNLKEQKHFENRRKEILKQIEIAKKEAEVEKRIQEQNAREEAERLNKVAEEKAKMEYSKGIITQEQMTLLLKEQAEKIEQNLRVSIELENEDKVLRLQAEQEKIITEIKKCQNNDEELNFKEQRQSAGYVYIISNIGAFGENVYKIGVTRRLDPIERIDELGSASVPFRFDIHAMIFSDNAFQLENALHKAFEKNRVNLVNKRKEFFKLDLNELNVVLKDNFNKNFELKFEADALDYRETLQRRFAMNSGEEIIEETESDINLSVELDDFSEIDD